MVVGDSISQGSSGDYTWRYRLYEHLVSDGLNPQLVGPYNWLFNNVTSTQGDCSYADPDFETADDAVWGRTLADEMTTIQGEVSTYQPDYLLVLIGINDLAFGTTDVAGTEANLQTFIANARAGNPDIKIVLGMLLPKANEDPTLASEVGQYNADMPTIAAQLSTSSSPIVVADDASAIDPSTDLWDGTHPNAEGEIKIAAGFADALATDFGLGSPYPTPLPTVPTGPIVAPQLTLTPEDGQAQLSWTLSPGGTGYMVYVKNVTAGDTTFTELPYPLTASDDPWTAGLLVNGATYEFELQACKGVNCNVFSNTATVTPAGPVPDAPTGLSATSGDGQATLSWTAAADATGYYVYQEDVTAGDTSFTKLPYAVSGTSWTAGLLLNGHTYEYELQSVDGLTTGGTTAPVTVMPTGPTPDAPAGLSAAPGDGQATLSWTAAANATGYYVYEEDVTAGDTSFTKLPYPVPGSSWTAGDLENGATYEFELQSVNGGILGGTTAPVTVMPTGPTPDAPAGLSAAPGDGQATLSWTAAANATGYYVYEEDVTAGDTSFTELPYPVSGSSWTAGDLENGATYEFELQSIDGLDTGGTTTAVQVTPSAAPPPAPTGLAAAAGDHSAKLTWTEASGATGYYVYEKDVTAGDTSFTKLPYPVSGSSWTAAELVNGATYQFELQSIDGLITGDTSGLVTVTPTGPAPAAPANFAATAGDGKAILTWTLPADATCVYIFQKDVSAGDSGFTELPYPVCDDEFTAGDLVNGATYQYELQAYDDLIPGGTSGAVTVTPTGPAPPGPETLTVTPGNEKATLHWNEASQATSYYVWQKADTLGGGWTQLPYPVAGDTFVGGDLVNGAQYEYKVQSIDGLEPGGYSNTVTVTPLGPTPEAPGDLSGSGSWHGTASLTWSTSWTATAYWVYVSDNGGAWTQLTYPVTGGSWTAGYLIPGHTYRFQLQAVSGYQLGDWSNIASVDIPLPPAPTGMSASTGGPYQAHLSWNPVPGADGYYIYYGTTDAVYDYPTMHRLPYPVTTNHFTASYLFTPGIQWFAVTAIRYGVEGGQSNLADTTVYMENPMYWDASAYVYGGVYTPGGENAFTNLGAGDSTDRGIVLVRAFIQPTDLVLLDIGDQRGFTAEPLVSSRAVIGWDSSNGEIGVHIARSCEQIVSQALCDDALPVVFGTSNAADGTPVSYNYVYGSGAGGAGSLLLQWKLTQSQAAGFPDLSEHIDGAAFLSPNGGSFNASLLIDGFPSNEVYQYPHWTINGVPVAYTLAQCQQAGPGFLGLLHLDTAVYGQVSCGN